MRGPRSVVETIGVYLVTDAAQAASRGRTVAATVRAAVDGGVRWVQLRAKGASDDEVLAELTAIADVVPDEVRLLVNDRPSVVRAALDAGVRVDGVHLGQDDGDPAAVRRLLGAELLLGVSASTPDQVAAAAAAGADHVGIGAVRATATKTDAPAPLGHDRAALLAAEAARHGLAAVAIGGLGAADLPLLRDGGFAGAAVVSAICAAEDPGAVARSLVAAWTGIPS